MLVRNSLSPIRIVESQTSTMNEQIVQVKQGSLKGSIVKNIKGCEYLAFHGIPYAEPPIGDLRFKDPRPPKTWTGIRDVGDMSIKCCQYDPIFRQISGSEDCLYLNVATKKLIGKQPVMVFIHGGGFIFGSPDTDTFGPDYLVRHDVVYVGIAYRLGSFGFLNLGLPDAAGNQGLKDQILALKWIKENIHVFGGDPENITLFGQSAGSACVHLLTVSPLTQGLFHKVIMQSGTFLSPWAIRKKTVETGLQTAAMLGKRTKDPAEALEFLKTVPTTDLVEVQKMQKRFNANYGLLSEFAPTIDRNSVEPVVTESPIEMAKRCINMPVIIGLTSEEGLVAIIGPNYEKRLRDYDVNFTGLLEYDLGISGLDKKAKDARKYYFGDDAITVKNINKFVQFRSDILFMNGIQQVVDIQMNKSMVPTYLYRFSYRPSYRSMRQLLQTNVEGSCHGDEMGALFYSNISKDRPHEEGNNDRLIMERMTLMWTNFAKTGNPTPELDNEIPCKWEPITQDKKNYMDINDDLTLRTNPDEDAWNFWKAMRLYDIL